MILSSLASCFHFLQVSSLDSSQLLSYDLLSGYSDHEDTLVSQQPVIANASHLHSPTCFHIAQCHISDMKQRLLKISLPRRPRHIRKALHSQGPKPIYLRFLCTRPLLAPVAFKNSLVAFGIFEPQNALRMSLHYTLRKTAARCLSSIPWLFSGQFLPI